MRSYAKALCIKARSGHHLSSVGFDFKIIIPEKYSTEEAYSTLFLNHGWTQSEAPVGPLLRLLGELSLRGGSTEKL